MRLLRRVLAVGLPILWVFSQVHGGFAQESPVRRRVLIGFERASGPDVRAQVVHGAGGEVNHAYHLLPVVSATLTDEMIAWLKGRPDIAYVEEDIRVYASEQSLPWGVDRIDAELVWKDAPGNAGAGVDVAVLDTGIDSDHPDLSVAGGINYTGQFVIDGSTRATDWDDKQGHGTHCAGVIGARDNDIGVVGVAPEANLWAVKVLSDDRSGYISDVIQGLEWCVDNGIEIASMSFVGAYSTSLEKACETAYQAGVLLVAASGNSGEAVVGYPAAHDSVIAVSAVDSDGALAEFSNTGPEIELAAPGVVIESTYCGGTYTSLSGTSMACPHVAGAAALVWACPELALGGAVAVRTRLCETAEKLSYLEARAAGFGLVDARRAATPIPVTDLAITAVAVVTSVVRGDSVDVTVTVENLGNQDVDSDLQVALACDPEAVRDGDDHFVIGRQVIPGGLDAGVSVTLAYTWDTQAFANDSYTLTGSHDLLDDDMANNSCCVCATVRSAIVDVAVNAVHGPETVFLGESAEISVTVENLGDHSVDSDIEVVLTADNTTAFEVGDDLALGTQVIRAGLAAGESATLTYIWDTQGAMTGVHTLMASHDFADDNADNDAHMATVAIVEVALPEVVVNYVTPHGLWAGMQSSLMIRGDGFCEGLSVAFEGSQGPAPTVTSIRVLGSGSLVSRVTTPSELPLGPVTWDVRITNPDGSSGVLHQAFTVQP